MSIRWRSCWDADPQIHGLLKESDNLELARERLVRHLEELDWVYRRDVDKAVESWRYILIKESVRCMKNIISQRNERLAETSPIKYLWTAARTGDAEVSDDFIEELTHLFKAINGRAEVYPPHFMRGLRSPDFEKYKGRAAAQKRSAFLERIGERMEEYLSKYPSGLVPEIIERRARNKRRILDILKASNKDWNSWRWQFNNVFKDKTGFEVIKKAIRLTLDEERGIRLAIENRVPFGVTPHYLHLMDQEPSEIDFAVRRQVFPPPHYVRAMMEHRRDRKIVFDYMRERDTSPLKLVTRRYPRVAIMKPYDSCPQICVYCQRNWEITSPFYVGAGAAHEDMEAAIDWFAEHKSIMDVLITGGDPLVMDDEKIDYILQRFSQIPHIRNIRLATRIPITVPQRVTDELCNIFSKYYELGKQTLCMVTHFSHPYEVTFETARAIKRVKMHGLHVYNQEVFGFANSRRFETAALRIAMKQIGVDPYYIFNMKGKTEIEDYAAPVARILQEQKEEARLLPGVFRTDEAVFNVPFLGKNYLKAWQEHELISIAPDGRRIYSFHPWEKNIAKTKPYIYTDVTIKDYLGKLEARGEDLDDYKSIWYYY
ncbi:radical SAM protein [candidate division WOR_3 bacterium SM23_42]|uniref:Radical SAM protein n=1 Tax=candidate division WOR_3 bacterium SM23_42 TaxID=1703779 RepID=A0A0S8FUV2_UNCW3|nr:MAG: radical SAM protein [candidate division WOR_3 bacterium SM23_42]